MARSRTKTAVHFYVEDGFLVRGTLDPHEALALAVAHEDYFEARYYVAECTRRDDDEENPLPEDVLYLGDLCHRLITEARSGLYRIVPAHPDDDEYKWWTRQADVRGPGVFEGVEFQ